MFKQLIATSLIIGSLMTPAIAWAQTDPTVTSDLTTTVASPRATTALTAAQERQLANLKQKATVEIDRRLVVLNNQLTTVTNNPRIAADQKSQLTGEIQPIITKLTTLKTKIQAETDLVTLRADVATIKESYAEYGFTSVQSPILTTADQVLALSQTMATISARIQANLNEASPSATDKADFEKSLSSINTKLTGINTQVESVKTTVVALDPEAFPGNRSQLQSARNRLVVAITDLKTVRRDLQAVYQDTKAVDVSLTSTPASSAAQVRP